MIVLAQRFDSQVLADANIADEGKVGRICNTLVKFDRTLEFWVIGCDTTTYQAKWRWQAFKQVYLDRTIGTKQGLRSVNPLGPAPTTATRSVEPLFISRAEAIAAEESGRGCRPEAFTHYHRVQRYDGYSLIARFDFGNNDRWFTAVKCVA